MFELLYSDVSFKTSGLPVFSMLSMVVKLYMASWLSLHTVDDTERDKTLNTALINAQLVPGAYIDELLPLRVAPCVRSPSASKLSLPGQDISVMACTEICESPVQEDCGASLIKGSPEDPKDDDTSRCTSDDSVCFLSCS
jgi:hypothetical protein